MNAGLAMTLQNVATHIMQMDALLDAGKTEDARNALADARRETRVLLDMIDTVNGAWSSMTPSAVAPVVHLIREGRTICGRFAIMTGFPKGHSYEEPPSDDADCPECLQAWRVNYLK